MIPVIALVGRPNVGKSTLFNCMTKTRDALVSEMPGMTRDRQYGQGNYKKHRFIVVDTGGIGYAESTIDTLMEAQSRQAIIEANIVFFLVDARDGVTSADIQIANELRKTGKTIHLVMNKIDGINEQESILEFHELGLGEAIPIAAAHRRGINVLLDFVLASSDPNESEEHDIKDSIRLAIVGKPNVGKSTLINRMLGEERVIACDMPGTTRDSIFLPLEHRGKHYTLIDTAGVRRRKNVKAFEEKVSVIKSLQAIEEANVVLMLIDAREGVSEHDLHLLGYILDAGRSLILCINKWDGLDEETREDIKRDIDRRLSFVDFAEHFFISALHGTNVGNLYEAIDKAYESANQPLTTQRLTAMLEDAVKKHTPPLVNGRRIKLRYANPGGHNPPIVVIHGNQVDKVPLSYVRYLKNFFRETLKLIGTPIRLEFKGGENPFKANKNKLSPRQFFKRKRQIRQERKDRKKKQ